MSPRRSGPPLVGSPSSSPVRVPVVVPAGVTVRVPAGVQGGIRSGVNRAAMVTALACAGALAFPLVPAYSAVGPVDTCVPQPGYDQCQVISFAGVDQTWQAPSGVTEAYVQAWGAGGGGSYLGYFSQASTGASGGYASGLVKVTAGASYTVVIGEGGRAASATASYGGGGAGGLGHVTPATSATGASGGGLTGLFSGSSAVPSTALLIAGGGGGATPAGNLSSGGTERPTPGGGGGTAGGENGFPTSSGRGGTQSAGGPAATSFVGCSAPVAGAALLGGAGASATSPTSSGDEGGGGGGGGWFGGGGGACQRHSGGENGNGGGGSGYLNESLATQGRFTAGAAGVFTTTGMSVAVPGPAAAAGYSAFTTEVIGRGGDVAAEPAKTSAGNGFMVIQWATPKRGPAVPLDQAQIALPAAVAGQPYVGPARTASGGDGRYTWSALGLPAGLVVAATNGVVSGTPTTAGKYDVSFRVCDGSGACSVRTETLMVGLAAGVEPNFGGTGGFVLPSGALGVKYETPVPSIPGASGPYTCVATGLPTGLALNTSTCQISGVPTQVGTSQVKLTLISVEGMPATGESTLVVTRAEVRLRPPVGLVNTAYRSPRPKTELIGPLRWSAKGLPPGLSINPSTGVISGVPSDLGKWKVTVIARGKDGLSTKVRRPISIRRSGPPHGKTVPSTGARIAMG